MERLNVCNTTTINLIFNKSLTMFFNGIKPEWFEVY